MEVSEAQFVMSMNESTRVFRSLECALVYHSLRRARLSMPKVPPKNCSVKYLF